MDTIENDIIKNIEKDPSIKKIEKSYGTIKLTYKSGITSYIQINLEDNLDTMARGGGKEYPYYVPEKYDQTIVKKYQKYNQDGQSTETKNKNIFIWAPFDTEWGNSDEVNLVKKLANEANDGVKVKLISDSKATANSLKNMASYGLIILASHGGNGQWIATGERVKNISAKDQKLTVNGQKVIVKIVDSTGIKDYFAVTDKWFKENISKDKLKDSILLNNSCESLKTNNLWKAFKSKGLNTYFGYSGVVRNQYIVSQTASILYDLYCNGNSAFSAYKLLKDKYHIGTGEYLLAKGQGNIKIPLGGKSSSKAKTKSFTDKDFGINTIKSQETRTAVTAVFEELRNIGLPVAVCQAYSALAASVVIPGVVLDSIALAGVIAVTIYYWDDIKASWNKLVKVMTDFCGKKVKPILDDIYCSVRGLPRSGEFSKFNDHYKKHASDFRDMPGGNGKKPDKKKYWEMAKKLLNNNSKGIKTGKDTQWKKSVRIIKFNPRTCEYLVYEQKTRQVVSYFLAKYDIYKTSKNIGIWRKKSFGIFLQ